MEIKIKDTIIKAMQSMTLEQVAALYNEAMQTKETEDQRRYRVKEDLKKYKPQR